MGDWSLTGVRGLHKVHRCAVVSHDLISRACPLHAVSASLLSQPLKQGHTSDMSGMSNTAPVGSGLASQEPQMLPSFAPKVEHLKLVRNADDAENGLQTTTFKAFGDACEPCDNR